MYFDDKISNFFSHFFTWKIKFKIYRDLIYVTFCASNIRVPFSPTFALYLSSRKSKHWKQICTKNQKIFMEKPMPLNVERCVWTLLGPSWRFRHITDRFDSARACSPLINMRWPGAKFVIFAAINRPGVRYGFPFDKGAESAYKFRWAEGPH